MDGKELGTNNAQPEEIHPLVGNAAVILLRPLSHSPENTLAPNIAIKYHFLIWLFERSGWQL